ncbi:tetratricopeptide repeat protein [Flavobacterium sp. DGU11]|uniref:Tetratricopeptide repeat protein n=1 Tax=Flavobacterium arundinis TaxID=3139143 RepID=A0ABU9I0D8_9FLAO
MKFILTLLLTISTMSIFAQGKVDDEIKALSGNKQYEKIIEQYASRSGECSAKSLYYIGLAYYMKEDDNSCIKFMDMSIGKDAKDPAPHYIKGSTLNYMDKYDEAIRSFQTAISLKEDNGEYYSGLGDSYYQLKKNDMALEAYKKAISQAKCPTGHIP